jgi:hypothetical protein
MIADNETIFVLPQGGAAPGVVDFAILNPFCCSVHQSPAGVIDVYPGGYFAVSVYVKTLEHRRVAAIIPKSHHAAFQVCICYEVGLAGTSAPGIAHVRNSAGEIQALQARHLPSGAAVELDGVAGTKDAWACVSRHARAVLPGSVGTGACVTVAAGIGIDIVGERLGRKSGGEQGYTCQCCARNYS